MSRSARGPRTVTTCAGALAVAALLAAGAGCGSSDGGQASETTPTSGAAPAQSASSSPAAPGSPPGGKASANVGKSPQGGHQSPSAGGQASAPQSPHPSDRTAAFHKALKSCPTGLPRAQCESLLKQAARSRHASSHPVEKPSDCLDAMGRAECEALLAAEKAAAQSGASTDVEECLQNPTPECEKVLRAAFGAQIAAQEAGN